MIKILTLKCTHGWWGISWSGVRGPLSGSEYSSLGTGSASTKIHPINTPHPSKTQTTHSTKTQITHSTKTQITSAQCTVEYGMTRFLHWQKSFVEKILEILYAGTVKKLL